MIHPQPSGSGVAASRLAQLQQRVSNLLGSRQAQWLIWLLISLPPVVTVIGGVPVSYTLFRSVCVPAQCIDGPRITTDNLTVLQSYGWTPDLYAAVYVGAHLQFTLICFALAALIIARQPREWMARIAAVTLLCFGSGLVPFSFHFSLAYPAWGWLFPLIGVLTELCFATFFFVFPDGRFVPRWSVFPAAIWFSYNAFPRLVPSFTQNRWLWSEQIMSLVELVLFTAIVAAQIYRYLRVSNTTQRQQTKWIVFGVVVALCTLILFDNISAFVPSFPQEDPVIALSSIVVVLLFFSLIPLTIGVAILRYRLWDIDILINRTLVYSALTASVSGIYVLVVGYLGVLFHSETAQLPLQLIATGIVAMLFQPIHARLQRGINRLMYGERDDPYGVIARLGQRLEGVLAPEAVLPTVVETVAHALKLPYVAIALATDDRRQMTEDNLTIAAAYGSQPATASPCHRVTVSYQGEQVGQLILAPRAPGEAFSHADQRLLAVLAQQAGVAAHAVQLTLALQQTTSDLQLARERLISAREEERRRLRRDLHDGIGPVLASLIQRLDKVRVLIPREPETAIARVDDVKGLVRTTLTEVRRLVYALRPPVLDEFGLISAIREHVVQYDGTSGLRVLLTTPERLPPLPAAVEVAAYRITLEGLTNVARHAQAQTCSITLALTTRSARRGLLVEVTDDGQGLSAATRTGVGLTAMRERAEELNGTFAITSTAGQGTQLCAWLPFNEEEL